MLRFTPKLRLATLWPAIAALGIATVLLTSLVPRLLERAAAEQLLASLEVLSPLVTQRLDEEPEELHAWVRSLAAGRGLRLTVVAADGTVLADSARSEAQLLAMDDHSDRPEIAAARDQGRGYAVRRSATTGRDYVYAARTGRRTGGELFFLRLARPLDQLQQLGGTLLGIVALAGAVALLFLAAISWWLDRRLFIPLSRLIQGAGLLAEGSYEHRLEVAGGGELAALASHLNRLAARIEEQIAAVAAERDHLTAILASMTEGVLVVDRQGRAAFANPAFEELFAVEGPVRGKLPLEVTRRRELARMVEDTLSRGVSRREEIELPEPTRRTLALSSAALAAPEGGGGAVVVARDTTEANRLAQMRRDFIANVSHELKTPLAAIRGYAETLRDGALAEPEAGARFVRRLLGQCRRLERLLEDLLTLSRLESIGAEIRRQPVSLAPLLRRAVETATAGAREKNVSIHLSQEPVPPLLGDADGLERLVTNLLDNAIKYNYPGGEVHLRLSAAGTDMVLLEVEDTGPGIPGDALPRLFERFFRVEKGRSRDEGGTGLGLAIVKHAAEAHGGRVEVASELGRGSRFRVWLPTERPETGRAEAAPPA